MSPAAEPALSLSELVVPREGGGEPTTVSAAVPAGTVACLLERGFRGLDVLSVLAGLVEPEGGVVRVAGEAPDAAAGTVRLARGGLRLCDGLTVGEHLELAGGPGAVDRLPFLELGSLVGYLERDVADLGLVQRQETEVASLLLTAPRCLVLHRPFEGLVTPERRRLAAVLRRVAAAGGAVLYTTRHRELGRYADLVFSPRSDEAEALPASERPEANATLAVFGDPADPAQGRAVGLLTRSGAARRQVQAAFRTRVRPDGRGVGLLFDPSGPWGGCSPRLTVAEQVTCGLTGAPVHAWGHVHENARAAYVREVLGSYGLEDIDPASPITGVAPERRPLVLLAGLLARVPAALFAWFPFGGRFGSSLAAASACGAGMLRRWADSGGAVVLCSDDTEVLARLTHEVRCVDEELEGRPVLPAGLFRRLVA